MGLSMPARVLLPGIWTECDDQGVFAWKPLTLKARLMPADAVDITAALFELARGNFLKRFTLGDKDYGAVRNFRKFQRPKKPTSIYPLPPEFRTYVGLTAIGGELVPHQDETGDEDIAPSGDTSGGKSPQMEGEGGRRSDEGGKRGEDARALDEPENWKPGDPVPDLWLAEGEATRAKLNLHPCDIALEAEAFTRWYQSRDLDLPNFRAAWLNWVLKGKPISAERAAALKRKDAAEAPAPQRWGGHPAEARVREKLGEAKFEALLGRSRIDTGRHPGCVFVVVPTAVLSKQIFKHCFSVLEQAFAPDCVAVEHEGEAEQPASGVVVSIASAPSAPSSERVEIPEFLRRKPERAATA
jgi:hypothetical protein